MAMLPWSTDITENSSTQKKSEGVRIKPSNIPSHYKNLSLLVKISFQLDQEQEIEWKCLGKSSKQKQR